MARPKPPAHLVPVRTSISIPTALYQRVQAEVARRHSLGQRADFSSIVVEALILHINREAQELAAAEDPEPPALSQKASELLSEALRVQKKKSGSKPASNSSRK